MVSHVTPLKERSKGELFYKARKRRIWFLVTYSWYSRPNTFDDRLVAEMPRLRRYARALTRDVDGADDLVQDVMAAALRWRTRYPDRADRTEMRAWLFTLLHNRYVSNVRRAVREGPTVLVSAVSEAEALLVSTPNQLRRLELRDLDRAMARLPEEQRTVVCFVALEGIPYSRVSEITGVPRNRVAARVVRARASLRSLIDYP